MQDLNDNMPELKIEHLDDGYGDGLILLTQDSGGNNDSVAIHPIHLRYMAEKMGLVESSDPTTHKTIVTLTRRMNLLRNRIEHLADWLENHSDGKHVDLSYGQIYATATAEIANEFCADLIDSTPVTVNVDSKKPAATKLPASPQALLI